MMTVQILLHSYFKELAGCSQLSLDLPDSATLQDALRAVHARFPKLQPLARSTLTAVGVEYQSPDHPLRDHDEISLFPPVQGG